MINKQVLPALISMILKFVASIGFITMITRELTLKARLSWLFVLYGITVLAWYFMYAYAKKIKAELDGKTKCLK